MMTLTNDGPKCRKCGDWIEVHNGKPVCKSGCAQTTIKFCECDEPENETRDGGRTVVCVLCGGE